MLPPSDNRKNPPSTSLAPNTPTTTTLNPFIYYTVEFSKKSNCLLKLILKVLIFSNIYIFVESISYNYNPKAYGNLGSRYSYGE